MQKVTSAPFTPYPPIPFLPFWREPEEMKLWSQSIRMCLIAIKFPTAHLELTREREEKLEHEGSAKPCSDNIQKRSIGRVRQQAEHLSGRKVLSNQRHLSDYRSNRLLSNFLCTSDTAKAILNISVNKPHMFSVRFWITFSCACGNAEPVKVFIKINVQNAGRGMWDYFKNTFFLQLTTRNLN